MNWKTELEKLLTHRKRNNNVESYLTSLTEVILPTFKEIEKVLSEHHINSSICNNDELRVDNCGFIMMVELVEDKVKITFRYLDHIEPIDMPPLNDSVEKFVAIGEVTKDLIGDEFLEAFKPMIKYFSLSIE
jgi:hypothetical protein